MAFRSKAYKNGAALIEEGRAYSPLDALRLAQTLMCLPSPVSSPGRLRWRPSDDI